MAITSEDHGGTPESVAAARYKERSGDFIRSTSVICSKLHDGWLPSSCMLLGFACELMAKRRLLLAGVSLTALRNTPYGHDISGMWRLKTKLFEEAEKLVSFLKQEPNANGVDDYFDWGLHFDQLAQGHSQSGDYSLRYHQGERHFADPKAMAIVLSKI